jgi:hypothetical protein
MEQSDSVILTKKLIITSLRPILEDEFIKKITELFYKLVNFLKDNGCEEIGHINFIATTDGEDYLQVNISNCEEKPKIKGFLRKTFNKISATLNIIEFGVDKNSISQKVDDEFSYIQSYFNSS